MTANAPPPTFTPEQSMIESSGWNLRLAALYGSWMRCTDSTTSSASRRPMSRCATSPTQPMIVCTDPALTCGSMFLDTRSVFRFSTCAASAFFFSMITIAYPFFNRKRETASLFFLSGAGFVAACLMGSISKTADAPRKNTRSKSTKSTRGRYRMLFSSCRKILSWLIGAYYTISLPEMQAACFFASFKCHSCKDNGAAARFCEIEVRL